MVSIERNRCRRCFASETIGSTALVWPSPGQLFSYSHGRSGAASARSPPCYSFSASVSAGCQRRLPATSIRRQSVGGRLPSLARSPLPGYVRTLLASTRERKMVTFGTVEISTRCQTAGWLQLAPVRMRIRKFRSWRSPATCCHGSASVRELIPCLAVIFSWSTVKGPKVTFCPAS
jgi:hypothetical protein